ncbi:THUMP domain-containing protein [Geomonas sp.]|uniref:THUMP domain-containing protein n=1 Tax=Geomonas sp. TaxID=2651584 RepID=UPI002B4A25E5|nr:THUMP domain-containing protein [Geomonas sp.]HJV37061.1 THUMP domain-containing protein [Geomonas sp.]
MQDWNVVITVHDDAYNKAKNLLEHYGTVAKTDFFNILVMRVADPRRFLDELREEGERDPQYLSPLARVLPVYQTFTFQTPPEFEDKARQAVLSWIPTLSSKSFHVRMHRRGFKGKLSGMEEEKFLDSYLLEALELAGGKGRITFDRPDAIIAVETIGPRAGLSLWTREELERYPLLHLD